MASTLARSAAGCICVAALLALTGPAAARIGPPPYSFSAAAAALSSVPMFIMPAVDLDRFIREDEERGPGPLRFAAPIPAAFGLSDGLWEDLPGGARLWRIRIVSPGARNLNVAFIPFRLPPGATVHLYTPDRVHREGPFHAADNVAQRELWTPILPGEDVVVEMFVPPRIEFEPELAVAQVDHGYRDFGDLGRGAVRLGEDRSGSCNIDVVCPEGDPWRDEIRSVAVYQRNGIWVCTGSLMNSWAEDPPPLFLTANHCGVNSSNDHTVVVYWNFQSPACGQHGGGSLADNQTGSEWLASFAPSDFTLIRLSQDPDPSFDVHYSGWDHRGVAVEQSTCIHHPSCDEKSISFNLDPLTTTSYWSDEVGGDGTHWRVDDWEQGTTEPGSSGSGLWDAKHRIVGQLHGGKASCSDPDSSDWFGKLFVSWEGGGSASSRLRDWLDPGNTGVGFMDGSEGACAYEPLTSGVAVEATGTPRFYSVNQTNNYWTAAGIRSSAGDDWDASVYGGTGPYPECAGALWAQSNLNSGVDVVVGDYNHGSLGTAIPKVERWSGSHDGLVEWDSGPDVLRINGPMQVRTTGPSDVLEIWDVFLEAGRTYLFNYYDTPGVDAKCLLFRNQTSSLHWAGRASAEFETETARSYTAPATDWYGVVVVNDNGGVGEYGVAVWTCSPPADLTSGVAAQVSSALAYASFRQQAIYWAAAGVRGDAGSDWDIRLCQYASGEQPPSCFSGALANSNQNGPDADFVIGDFNHSPSSTYYLFAYNYEQTQDGGTLEWDDGTDQIVPDGSPCDRNTGIDDVLETWDIYLQGGAAYWFQLDRSGSADTKLLLFQNAGGTYFAGRSAAVFETASPVTQFIPPATDWYGIVVVNDNGDAGHYSLRVTTSPSDVEPPADGQVSLRTQILPPLPNPSPSGANVRVPFTLAAPSQVELNVVDASGRIVASAPARDSGAGPGSWLWNRRDQHGREVPAGIYWVRMVVDRRSVGRERLVVLR